MQRSGLMAPGAARLQTATLNIAVRATRRTHARTAHRSGLHLSSGYRPLLEDSEAVTAEWREERSDAGADPFVLAGKSVMRSVLDEYEAEARVMERGHSTGWTEGGQSVRERLVREWATAYAERVEA